MTAEKFFAEIGMSKGGGAVYAAPPEADYAALSRLLKADRQDFFSEIRKLKEFKKIALKLFVDSAIENKSRFDGLGIDERIYFDSYRDIAVWCENCHKSFGEYGLNELEWLQKALDMRIFRLGRLQFELAVLESDCLAFGRKLFAGDVALNVHVPQGQPLDCESVAQSFSDSRIFFKGVTKIYTCSSWLLNPKLTALLPRQSNIIKFQSLFALLSTDEASRQAEERIYGFFKDDPADYPEQTSLQRAAKQYLAAGEKLGETFGIRIID